MRKIHRLSSVSMIICMLAFSAACTNVSQEGSAALAAKGSQAATASANAYLATNTALNRFIEERYLLSGMGALPPISPAVEKDIAGIETSINLRNKMMQDVVKLYASFNALAAYDASGEFSKAAGDLTKSANDFATAVGSNQPLLGAGGTDLVGLAAGAAGKALQSASLKKASQTCSAALDFVIPAVEKDKQTIDALMATTLKVDDLTVEGLFDKGIGYPGPILSDALGNIGLTYDEKAAASVIDAQRKETDATKRTLITGVRAVLHYRIKHKIELQQQASAQLIAALKELKTQHKKLEAGQPLTLQDLAAQIDMLTRIVNDLTSEISSRSSAKK